MAAPIHANSPFLIAHPLVEAQKKVMKAGLLKMRDFMSSVPTRSNDAPSFREMTVLAVPALNMPKRA
jgi:hypothetical protein